MRSKRWLYNKPPVGQAAMNHPVKIDSLHQYFFDLLSYLAQKSAKQN
jgi:hypothetical protein